MISHSHKFIFVHINKTAGTSIETALQKYSDSEDDQQHEMLHKILPCDGFSNKRQINLFSQCNGNPFDYFKFTFVRNPYDRSVSAYKFATQNNNGEYLSFKNYLSMIKTDDDKLSYFNQLDWITDEYDNIGVDFIGRFENLQEDFNIVCDKIGIPQQQLPHENATKHKHYTEYYDDETRKIVAKKYSKDIEFFGYKFGE